MPKRTPIISIAMVSAGALAYEILLMRLFSIIQWHHFAYMVIGLALLGYGFSGSVVAVMQTWLLPRYRFVYPSAILLFALSSVICFLLAQAIRFNPEAILWDGNQIIYLLANFVILSLPFFFAAAAICLTFLNYGSQISRVYAADLLGAGLGSLLVVGLLFLVFPLSALIVIGILGVLAYLVAGIELGNQKRGVNIVLSILCAGVLMWLGQYAEFNISPYKSLQQYLLVSDTHVVEERSSPLGYLSVVASNTTPFRHAPGLSLNATQEPLPQLGIFSDADSLSVITQYPENVEQLGYLDQMTSALPYHLLDVESALIVGAGGGADILQALYHDTDYVNAVELNPQYIDLVSNQFQSFSGGLYELGNIRVHNVDARDYLTKTKFQYDVIQLALIDAFNASSSGLYALNESYIYTVEALELYLKHLQPGGLLAITRWVKMPPRDSLKLFATAIDALSNTGIKTPGKQLVLIRSWQTSTLLIKNAGFTQQEVEKLHRFCEERSFDVAYTPFIQRDQVNRFNIFSQPLLYQGAVSLLGEQRQQYLAEYKFNLAPATDNQPFFHHFFRWRSFAEILQLKDKGGMPLLEWGYLILVATLIIALLASVILVLLPLIAVKLAAKNQRDTATAYPNKIKTLLYFFCIGLAFLFIEIAYMQKFVLFLNHPIYSLAVTLTAFLLFAGMGSGYAARFTTKYGAYKSLLISVVGVSALSVSYIFMLTPLFTFLLALPLLTKVLITLMLIAPLAFFMGLPFPLALTVLSGNNSLLVPWAWAINGCASVISAVLATLLAIHLGFNGVILLAVLLYVAILALFPMFHKTPQGANSQNSSALTTR